MIKVGEYVHHKQPEIVPQLTVLGFQEIQPEEELSPFQQFLEKLMRQRPRPGKGGLT